MLLDALSIWMTTAGAVTNTLGFIYSGNRLKQVIMFPYGIEPLLIQHFQVLIDGSPIPWVVFEVLLQLAHVFVYRI